VNRATVSGFVAIGMWAGLGLFTAASGAVPPLQLVAMAFALMFALTLVKWIWRRDPVLRILRQQPAAWSLGVGGLFGYHFFYFMALRNAPAVEANLINYLWPLLIVVFAALLPGERLRWFHLAGALCGLAGAVLLVGKGGTFDFDQRYALGYASAIACACIWASYSVLSRRFATVPTDTVGGFCGVTALLAAMAHLIFETTHWPETTLQWLAVAGLGIGPVGLAFFFWDHGVKHGHIQLLGAAAYAAPLMSTLLLILAGFAELTWSVAFACALITGGAVLASADMLRAQFASVPGRVRPIE
jgi:drug/metabolite transporter (DMT)-like permease